MLSVLLFLSSNLQLTKLSLTSYFPCWNFHCLFQSRLYSVISYKLLSPSPVIPHHSCISSSLISLKFFNLDKCSITVISEGIYWIIINIKKQVIFVFKWSLFWNIFSRTMAEAINFFPIYCNPKELNWYNLYIYTFFSDVPSQFG